MTRLIQSLAKIVGADYVSGQPEERFLYGRDAGTMPAAEPDAVVMPGCTEEVRRIVLLANEASIPLVPLGAGLVLSGLSRPLRGGIVLDMKRMNRVLAVNETSRYAVVEAGTAQGMLDAHLRKNHPRLKHSLPDAPPTATIAGNVLIHGSGRLSHAAGFHSDMLNGLEVVLPTGEVTRVGSCAMSENWFARAPLPDLAGLFLGWNGTTGIVTKLAVKLYPRHPLDDVDMLVMEDPDLMPEALYQISGTRVAEDLTAWMSPKPDWARGFQHLNVHYGAETREELVWKRNLIRAAVRRLIDDRRVGFMAMPKAMKQPFLEWPPKVLTRFADVRQGGGFEYVGAIMPVEFFGWAYRAGLEIAGQMAVSYSLGARIIGVNHAMMFFFAYAFNRADPADVARAQQALEETNRVVVEKGGIPWKAEAPAQRQILERMDPNTAALIQRIRAVLDPNGIMNPGNWEAL